MDIARLRRYKDKLDLISKRKSEINEWKEAFLEDTKTSLAVYKAFQEIVEAAMDILAMISKDENYAPKDDYSNIDVVLERKIIDKKISETLKEANGLRNRIIHYYNGLNAERAYESILYLLPSFDVFSEVVERWLEKKG